MSSEAQPHGLQAACSDPSRPNSDLEPRALFHTLWPSWYTSFFSDAPDPPFFSLTPYKSTSSQVNISNSCQVFNEMRLVEIILSKHPPEAGKLCPAHQQWGPGFPWRMSPFCLVLYAVSTGGSGSGLESPFCTLLCFVQPSSGEQP